MNKIYSILNTLGALAVSLILSMQVYAATDLADKPLFSGVNVSGNVALALSVEFPTALGSAYSGGYNSSRTKKVGGKDVADPYIGYFDSEKCYQYKSSGIPTFFNTGVDDNGGLLADGTSDPHWKSSVGGDTDKVDINSYTQRNSTSQSIGKGNPGVGSYTYTTTFNIPVGKVANDVTVSFKVAYDDQLSSIIVNGKSTGISNGELSRDGISIKLDKTNTTFIVGNNTIAITIYNSGGGAGIRVDQASGFMDDEGSYFQPVKAASAQHDCTGYWSGNLLNWALTQTIDPLRYALTGGYRAVDRAANASAGKPSLTVLEKAWASGQGGTVYDPTISNNQALISKSTPYSNLSSLIIRIAGLGNKLTFTGSSNATNTIAEGKIPVNPDPNLRYEMFARVKVCDAAIGVESNCKNYGNNNYKPEGLIQKNAMKLNFAAFGYLNDSNIKRDGGVLRAQMASLGPLKPVPNSPSITNPNPEWDGATGVFFINPDPADAEASKVSNSGVINYLNKFGLTGPGYKTYDPVGELYYSVIRYYKNLGNVSSYTDGATATMIDGFPVITKWNDPIEYQCQANFIIGVGDSNSHADANLPGSTIASGNEPSLPTAVNNDKTVDVKLATNKVGELEGAAALLKLGERYTPWCCSNNSFFMAGLAYDSHTKDMRPDKFKLANSSKTAIQTVSTYWLDVLESGDRKDSGGTGFRNQFWLAAKYGGFTVPDPLKYKTYDVVNGPIKASWDADGDVNGDPDNYFRANQPDLMITNLNKAFKDIVDKTNGSSSSFAITAPAVGNGSMAYATSYNIVGWSGDVKARKISVSNTGVTSENPELEWSAADKLEIQATGNAGFGWSESRFIATSNCIVKSASEGTQDCDGVPFRFNALVGTQSTLGANAVEQQNVLNFLRGDRSNSSLFRNDRAYLLGDIINSKVVPIAVPSAAFTDSFNPGYSKFKSDNASRKTVVYVGANDGMLHAFDGDPSGGNELFAYVPNALFNGPNGTPGIDGLAALSKIAFSHHYYVDSTPRVTDVNFGGGNTDWHSLLVGGLGKGGKSYYALDVTNPGSLSSESSLKDAVLWEFKHKNMGYSFGRPLMVKTAKDGWVVILTSGYNNFGGGVDEKGKGFFFIVNPKDGSLIQSISTGEGSVDNEAGLANVTAFVADSRDFKADAAYAGDLLGNVWRLDLTCKSPCTSYPTPIKIASVGKPITVPPVVEVDQSTSKRYVFVGTGKLLAESDILTPQSNTFYAFNDGTETAFFTASTLPSGVTFPIMRANLIDNTLGTEGISTTQSNDSLGYFVDVGQFRINVDMRSGAGIIAFAANQPGGDVCKSTGSGRLFALTYGTGRSVLSQSNSPTKFIPNDSSMISSIGQFNITGKGVQISTTTVDGSTSFVTPTVPGISGFTQLNWRELPTAD